MRTKILFFWSAEPPRLVEFIEAARDAVQMYLRKTQNATRAKVLLNYSGHIMVK